ncbi:MAG: hypothetical protein JO302_05470 [Candidatus Eremiobacteraeota bacterium]|nr:hypothetical protein [Candidatus Eremiobacteraeota bacterium]
MVIRTVIRQLPIIVCWVALAACSQAAGPARLQYVPATNPFLGHSASTWSFKVVHSFGNREDGYLPAAALVDVKGVLYGTTRCGGAYATAGCNTTTPYSTGLDMGGTVYSLTADGKERVLHSFGKPTDGTAPNSSLLDVNGTLYGTTMYGGANNYGTLFSISTTSKDYRLLYSFGGETGGQPVSGLIDVNGKLYGTTFSGGTYYAKPYHGTIFSVSTNGAHYRVLHNFGNGTDGGDPIAGVIDVQGTLYGTTSKGGTYGATCGAFYSACGTAFSISKTGKNYHTIHDFGNGMDGARPAADLLYVNGMLYGTTALGGVYVKYGSGAPIHGGTVFEMSTNGMNYRVLQSFGHVPPNGAAIGEALFAGLIDVNGTLYGVTSRGVAGGSTVFSLSTSGSSFSEYNLPYGDDEASASLIAVGGTLYGTTACGGAYGAYSCAPAGYGRGGTVFALVPQ